MPCQQTMFRDQMDHSVLKLISSPPLPSSPLSKWLRPVSICAKLFNLRIPALSLSLSLPSRLSLPFSFLPSFLHDRPPRCFTDRFNPGGRTVIFLFFSFALSLCPDIFLPLPGSGDPLLLSNPLPDLPQTHQASQVE